MALAFPLSLTQFFDTLPISQEVFDLSDSWSSNENGAGEIMKSRSGPVLWQGSFTVLTHGQIDADDLVARADLIRQQGGTFLVSPRHLSGPFYDQTGVILGAATPTFTTVNVNMRDVNIGGLPSFYVLRRGDFIGFQYGSSPVRYALHRVVTGGTANVSGGIASVELSPSLRPGAIAGMALTLIKPVCKATLVPGAFDPQSHAFRPRSSFTINWRQTLR